MTKILFVENRGKTQLWQCVAHDLLSMGYEVAWLVQNPRYAPKSIAHYAAVHILPFPSGSSPKLHDADTGWCNDNFPELITDRGRQYFESGSQHYAHYRQQIERVFDIEAPDVVIGEPTLFHELLTIGICKTRKIPYLHPCATRYPSGRFNIMGYDTQHTIGGTSDILSHADALNLAQGISKGQVVPAYMRKSSRMAAFARKSKLVLARASVWLGHWQGERYNTPSLKAKGRLQRQLSNQLRQWTKLEKIPEKSDKCILYPLQMQPEANIDVWGRPFSDQITVIRQTLAASPADVQIAVKANPKSKYEVSAALLDLAKREPRICLLPLTMKMAEAQNLSIGTLTVTGTVGFEAVMGKGRAISLRHPIIQELFPSLHADHIEQAVQRLLTDPASGVGSVESGALLIQALYKRSFPGLINEPLYDSQCIKADNIKNVSIAIHTVLSSNLHNQVIA